MSGAVRSSRRGRAAHRQRGVLALALTMTIFVAMALTLAYANRNLLTEQRGAAQQQRASQALAAAEAGVDWAIAQLDANRRIGTDCLPSPDPTAASFRSRFLTIDASGGGIVPTTRVAGGAPVAPRAACARGLGGWQCACDTTAALPTQAGDEPAPAFRVRFAAETRPGVVRLVVDGCDRPAGACDPAGGGAADATAQVEVLLALLPALPSPPAAALTSRGDVETGIGRPELALADPSAAAVVDAGGAVHAPFARVDVAAGGALGAALVDHDTALAGASPERFFGTFFGMPPAAWTRLPAISRIVCPADCGDALAAEVDGAADAALVWVDGDLNLAGPRRFGTPERPVLLVVTGTARFEGAVAFDGVLQADAFAWHDGTGGRLRGALLSAGTITLDGSPTVLGDGALVQRLQRTAGSFVRVAGSWRDFGATGGTP